MVYFFPFTKFPASFQSLHIFIFFCSIFCNCDRIISSPLLSVFITTIAFSHFPASSSEQCFLQLSSSCHLKISRCYVFLPVLIVRAHCPSTVSQVKMYFSNRVSDTERLKMVSLADTKNCLVIKIGRYNK